MGRSTDESSRFLEFKNTLNVDDHVQRVTAIESAKRQKLEDQRAPEHLRGGSSGDFNSLPAFRNTDKPSKANGMEELQCPKASSQGCKLKPSKANCMEELQCP